MVALPSLPIARLRCDAPGLSGFYTWLLTAHCPQGTHSNISCLKQLQLTCPWGRSGRSTRRVFFFLFLTTSVEQEIQPRTLRLLHFFPAYSIPVEHSHTGKSWGSAFELATLPIFVVMAQKSYGQRRRGHLEIAHKPAQHSGFIPNVQTRTSWIFFSFFLSFSKIFFLQ